MTIPIYLQQMEATQRKLYAQREKKVRQKQFREFENRRSFKPMDNPTPKLPIEEPILKVEIQNTSPVQWIPDFEKRTKWMKFETWLIQSVWNRIIYFFNKK